MDAFALRDKLVSDYRAYAESFLTIKDERIREYVRDAFDRGLLWPEPRIQLNPAFESGGTIDEAVDEGALHDLCRQIFRVGKEGAGDQGSPMRLYRHQREAIDTARRGENYVLTTGTGSGKSLGYLIPVVDRILRDGAGGGSIKAIVVYPMNALANSQLGELEKYLNNGFPDGRGPVSFRRYTGQEDDEERGDIIANPPDILLTNYVMLEYILTRPREQNLVRAARDLKFLVLDELHTYRGRQGADVAMLVRRVREATGADALQCVGTSATLAGAGSYDEQRREVAAVASRLFGAEVLPAAVIGETLRPATTGPITDASGDEAVAARVRDGGSPPAEYEEFVDDPLARWIEGTFGVREDDDGRLVRCDPRPLTGPDGGAGLLAKQTGLSEDDCTEAIKRTLLGGASVADPTTGFPVFAFRLHQFFSGGGTLSASLENEGERSIRTDGQRVVPGAPEKVLLPLAFCRQCGQEYYSVRIVSGEGGEHRVEPRDVSDRSARSGERNGYLYLSTEEPWSDEPEALKERLPDDWFEPDGETLRREARDRLPESVRLSKSGVVGGQDVECHFVEAPFRFCLSCGTTYTGRSPADYGKLATLGAGGRSTATTILALSALRGLRESDLEPKKRKLLSFTDNRQDASLQAGHFNDFVEIGLLRSALYKAVAQSDGGLTHEVLTQKVFDALELEFEEYAADPDLKGGARRDTERALREVLGYRLYRDLQRGWRLTSPNLEQVGLLRLEYEDLDEAASDAELWEHAHPALAEADPETRARIARTFLDYIRRELAIKVDYLDAQEQEQIKQRSKQRLTAPWALDEQEQLVHARTVYPRPRRPGDSRENLYVSGRGMFGQYLRRSRTFPHLEQRLGLDDSERIIAELLEALRRYGLVEVVDPPREDREDHVPGYQIPAAAMRWEAGDGSAPAPDPLRVTRGTAATAPPNEFFVDLYRRAAAEARGLEAREHTAQVLAESREEREQAFRSGRLPLLFCSPTMELGIDIAELNVVNMRNVPPTPANYAQRSGRAGRSGQAALVFAFCSSWNSHDQYFFRRPEQMVSGRVAPPAIDLTNEDLVRAHVQAIWLAESGMSLGSSLADVLDVEGENPSLELKPSIRDDLRDERARQRAKERAARVVASIGDELEDADWYTEAWLDNVINAVELRFDQACERWRGLYRAARRARDEQHRIIGDATRSPDEKRRARQLRNEAETQLQLLLGAADGVYESDFYTYRYFASEGFLPGYNFPRLPISAYVAARRGPKADEFVSRPRFLAISEFGPRSIIYHEGSRYIINRVILPVGEAADEQTGLPLRAAKICRECGYVHPLPPGDPGPDLCRHCGSELDIPMRQLLRLQNVATRRRDRINSDEEERVRQGFEIRSAVNFGVGDGGSVGRAATVSRDGGSLARLLYGAAATIWRINLGWLRRADQDQFGFVLDTERGYWQSNEQAPVDDPDDPMSAARARVIPFVEDRRNALLFQPQAPLDTAEMASLQAALKRGIQAAFQLEDAELAAEPLPSDKERRQLLLFESTEGGAGVLRRLVEVPNALPRVARAALEICHFDPDTGADTHAGRPAAERCELACYDCLLSYTNQRDHALLDRNRVREFLLALATADVDEASGGNDESENRLEALRRACESDVEREWLDFLAERRLRLPSHAQQLIASCRARPDFEYRDSQAVVFIDGPHHEREGRPEADAAVTECLENAGYEVIRFKYSERDRWEQIIAEHPSVFGVPGNGPSA